MSRINKFGESSSQSSSTNVIKLRKDVYRLQQKLEIDVKLLRNEINIINSKIDQINTSLNKEVGENVKFISDTFDEYSKVIYTKYIESLQQNIKRLEDVIFKLIDSSKLDEVEKIKINFPVIKT